MPTGKSAGRKTTSKACQIEKYLCLQQWKMDFYIL